MQNKLTKFIKTHISSILNSYQEEIQTSLNRSLPFDLFIKRYFKNHKSIGQRDRFIIQENSTQMIRFKEFLDHISPKPLTWESRLDTMHSQTFNDQKKNKSLKPHIQTSCPKDLFDLISQEYGESKALQYCDAMNEKAPLTVRVNPIKITRDKLFEKWIKVDKFLVKKCDYSPMGITFLSPLKENLYESSEFKKGYFEIQDEASQLVSQRIQCEPGQKVMDFCGGAGGKSLAFAPLMKGTGQIYVCDVRKSALDNARERFKRSGIQNIQFHDDYSKLTNLHKKIDWLVLDVPCTGSGTLRRNPDLKWKFNLQLLDHMVKTQEGIFDHAIKFLKDDGKLVYITCSLLPQENIQQIIKFCKQYDLEIVGERHFQSFPERKGMDAFFSATLQLKRRNN